MINVRRDNTDCPLSRARARDSLPLLHTLVTRSVQAPKCAEEKRACVLYLRRSDGDDDDGKIAHEATVASDDVQMYTRLTRLREDEVKSSRGTKYTGYAGYAGTAELV